MAYCNNQAAYVNGTPMSFTDNPNAVLTLGKGNTLSEMLRSKDTVLPDGICLFTGAESDKIPHSMVGSRNDLVIYAANGLVLTALSVRYYDVISDTWVGPIYPATFLTNGSFNWGCWKNFAQIVVPFKCVLTLQGAFVECPDEDDPSTPTPPPSGDGDNDFDGTVDDSLDGDSDNAVSNSAVTKAIEELTDRIDDLEDDTRANEQTTEKVIEGLRDYHSEQGIGYTVINVEDLK